MATLSLGCRWPTLLLAPHSSCTTPSCTTTTGTAAKGGPRGITKPHPISPALQEIVGVPEIPRTQALKQIWAYIKKNNLQDPDNKKIIICDEKLKKILGDKERVGFLEIAVLITPYFLK